VLKVGNKILERYTLISSFEVVIGSSP
jgi:hypothetical protein